MIRNLKMMIKNQLLIKQIIKNLLKLVRKRNHPRLIKPQKNKERRKLKISQATKLIIRNQHKIKLIILQISHQAQIVQLHLLIILKVSREIKQHLEEMIRLMVLIRMQNNHQEMMIAVVQMPPFH